MGSDDEFGPDTETIRAWLSKRASYADDARVAGAPRDPVGTPGDGAGTADRSCQAPAARSAAAAADDTPLDDGPPEAPRGAPRHARRPPDLPDSVTAGRTVLDALAADPPADPPVAPAAPTADPQQRADDATATTEIPSAIPPARVAEPVALEVGRWTEPIENITAARASTDVEFPVRTVVPRTLTVILAASLAGTAAAAYLSWQRPSTATVGAVGILGLLSLLAWAARAGTTTTGLSIHHGQLSVHHGGRVEVIDLSSQHTPIAIIGEPGQRRWRVLIERPGLPLTTISRAMVDPHSFTAALFRVRPDLRPGAGTAPREPAEQGDSQEHGVGQAS